MRGVPEGHCWASLRRVPSEMSTTDSQPKADRGLRHSYAPLFPGALPLRKTRLDPGFKVLHLLEYPASRLRGTVGSVCSRLTQPGSLLLKLEEVGRSRQIRHPAGWLLTMSSFPLGQDPEYFVSPSWGLGFTQSQFPGEVPCSGTVYTVET